MIKYKIKQKTKLLKYFVSSLSLWFYHILYLSSTLVYFLLFMKKKKDVRQTLTHPLYFNFSYVIIENVILFCLL